LFLVERVWGERLNETTECEASNESNKIHFLSARFQRACSWQPGDWLAGWGENAAHLRFPRFLLFPKSGYD
jgi:hypothetical protein